MRLVEVITEPHWVKVWMPADDTEAAIDFIYDVLDESMVEGEVSSPTLQDYIHEFWIYFHSKDDADSFAWVLRKLARRQKVEISNVVVEPVDT